MNRITSWALLSCWFTVHVFAAPRDDLPVIPIGLDALRQWERWPVQRIGVRAYMRSTYDRAGGNESADASHFLYQLADDFNVTLDVAGPGVLYFARYNHWHGSPWHYVVDGVDHFVRESSTADPTKPVRDSVFLPEKLFPHPLAWTWSVTKGADLSWVPIPFEKSFQMAYSRTRYGTGYYIYHQYVGGTSLSQPIKAWDGRTPPETDVLELIGRAGSDLVPAVESAEGKRMRLVEQRGGPVTLTDQAVLELTTIKTERPAVLRALEFSIPRAQAIDFGRARLRVTWDSRKHASVEAPIALFFGAGTLYNRDDREYLVKAFPVFIRYDTTHVHLACFFPMPFFESARIELLGNGRSELSGLEWRVRHQPLHEASEHVGYFHATYRDHSSPERGRDLVLLDTRETEGGGDWSGSFVGTSFIFSERAQLGTLEGDPRFFFDDSQTPQAYGTGTEEWGGGGDYWGGLNMTLPFAGHPAGARDEKSARDAEDKIESAYRFLLADLMPFGRNARICLEHGGQNESEEHYQTATYWYGAPGATLVKSDTLQIGDVASEQAHRYVSPNASAPYEITSRYEWGPDLLPGPEGPRANPDDCAEFEFEASAGKPYAIWVRGRNLDGRSNSDAFWMQFDDDIGTTRRGRSHAHPKGFGNWLDRFPAGESAWSSALPQDPPQTVTFDRGGKHRLRIQPRHVRHHLETVWLSATRKTLPEATQVPANSNADEIVLRPSHASALKGAIKRVADASVLEINGAATDPAASVEVFPAHTDRGRKMTGSSEFTLKIDPQNVGVMLRRKLDYAFANQRATVEVADATGDRPAEWRPAGTWYLAGSNTCVYSDPKQELGATQHIVQTSNRRFRDDEFLLARDLTEGRSAIRVRVKFTAVERPLFPGHPQPELAWSEIRYDAYCFLRPRGIFGSVPPEGRLAHSLEPIVVSLDGKGFMHASSKEPFRPWGVNYGNAGRLIEDFWDSEWQTVVDDFGEIKAMGANVIRVHLQFGRFMAAADQPNAEALSRLKQLLTLAENTGLYLDITGLACYRPADIPGWYDKLDDNARWEAQATFWRAVAEQCATSPAVFCYDLMNEPVSPGAKTEKWYSGMLLGGFDFIQYIAHNPEGKPRGEIAIAWIRKLTAAIREKDPKRLITVGMLPWETKWKHLSGFVPREIAPHLDFLSVHIYPKTKQPDEALRALRECDAGKAVVIEETFPLECTTQELETFLRSSRQIACGWMFHYDGATVEELDALEREKKLTLAQHLWREGLRSFIRLRLEFTPSEPEDL